MRLINADKIHPDVRTQRGALAISQGQLAYAKTVNAIIIPENATNGDMIKAMFPNAKANVFVKEVGVKGLDTYSTFTKKWWNAPYEGGKEE